MNTETAIEAPAPEISFGGLLWKKNKREDRHLEYFSINQDGDRVRVYQYPDMTTGWLWGYEFDNLLKGVRTQAIDFRISAIVDDRDTAMMCAADAKSILLSDITLMLNVLMPDSQYAQGFRAGQEDIKAKVAEVVL